MSVCDGAAIIDNESGGRAHEIRSERIKVDQIHQLWEICHQAGPGADDGFSIAPNIPRHP